MTEPMTQKSRAVILPRHKANQARVVICCSGVRAIYNATRCVLDWP